MGNQHPIILLVDDDEYDLLMIGQTLKSLGPEYEIQQVNNGWEAITRLNEMVSAGHRPCLIVLDLNMPKMDGKYTYIAIQGDEQLKKIPIVIMTTSASAVDKAFFENRQVEVIIKPTESNMLYEVTKKLLGRCNS